MIFGNLYPKERSNTLQRFHYFQGRNVYQQVLGNTKPTKKCIKNMKTKFKKIFIIDAIFTLFCTLLNLITVVSETKPRSFYINVEK